MRRCSWRTVMSLTRTDRFTVPRSLPNAAWNLSPGRQAVSVSVRCARQLADVRKYFQSEQAQGFVVLLIDGSVVVQHDDTGVYTVEDKLVVLLPLGGFTLYIMQDTGYAVQRTVYEAVVFGSIRFGEVDGGIVVFDGIEHEKNFTGVAAVQPLLPVYCQRKKHGEQDSPEQSVHIMPAAAAVSRLTTVRKT